MRLYKMELYKICHRKIFVVGAVCVVGILLLYFWMRVSEESAYVDGVLYNGYQAVKVNREITKEFEGVLTDEKVEKIVDRYGLPKEVRENYSRFYDSNFLNSFVVEHLSDGYLRNWNDYKVAANVYPIAETELGKASELTGKKVVLEYSNGWYVFLEVLQLGMVLGSILLIFGISILFAGERQAKMLQLLFTTSEGKKNDIYIKIITAFMITIVIWLTIVMLDFLFCGIVYGFGGQDCFIGTIDIQLSVVASNFSPSILTVKNFVVIILLRSCLGILLLCAATIYISARSRSSFHAVTGAAICYGAPILIWILLSFTGRSLITRLIRSIILLGVYSSSLYLSMYGAFYDIYRRWWLPICIAVGAMVLCTIGAYRRYRGNATI